VSVIGGIALLVGAGIVAATGEPDSGQTALQQAIDEGTPSDVAQLLADGADPDATDSTGATPLMLAVVAGGENVQPLLDAGADPDLQDSDGWTALHHALPRADIASVRLLLDAGADPTVEATGRRYDGRSACDVAREAASKVDESAGSPWAELEQLLCDE
jgi:ankyrin repeat protein